jgi:hypothetical protein
MFQEHTALFVMFVDADCVVDRDCWGVERVEEEKMCFVEERGGLDSRAPKYPRQNDNIPSLMQMRRSY